MNCSSLDFSCKKVVNIKSTTVSSSIQVPTFFYTYNHHIIRTCSRYETFPLVIYNEKIAWKKTHWINFCSYIDSSLQLLLFSVTLNMHFLKYFVKTYMRNNSTTDRLEPKKMKFFPVWRMTIKHHTIDISHHL